MADASFTEALRQAGQAGSFGDFFSGLGKAVQRAPSAAAQTLHQVFAGAGEDNPNDEEEPLATTPAGLGATPGPVMAGQGMGDQPPPVQRPVLMQAQQPMMGAPSPVSSGGASRFASSVGEAEGDLQKAQGKIANADKQVAEALGARQDALATAEAQRQNIVDEQSKFIQRKNLEQKELRTKQDEERSRVESAVQEAQSEVDAFRLNPQRLFKENTGNAIAAGIAIALGGIGQALGGGQNQALGLVQGAIDRDIDLQKEELAQLKGKAAGATNQLSRLKERFSDERDAESMLRIQGLQLYESQLDSVAKQSQNVDAIAKLEEQKTQIGAARAREVAAMKERAVDRVAKQTLQEEDIRQKEGALAVAQMKANAAPKIGVTGLDGGEMADPKQDLPVVKQQMVAYDEMQSLVTELKSLREQIVPGDPFPSEAKARARQISKRLMGPLRKDLGLGVMSESDKELVEDITGGDPTRIGEVMVLLDGMLGDSRRKTESVLRRHGNFRLPEALPEGPAL